MFAALLLLAKGLADSSVHKPLPQYPFLGPSGNATVTSSNGILSETWYEPDGWVLDADYDGDLRDINFTCEGDSTTRTHGWAQVDAQNNGGWCYVEHGFYIEDSNLGGYDTVTYRYNIAYADFNYGSKAWAFCRMYLIILKYVSGEWQYAAGNSRTYDSSWSGYDELSVDYDFQSGAAYTFQMFSHNYAKAYEMGWTSGLVSGAWPHVKCVVEQW